MPRIQLPHTYEDIISVENLLGAWSEFARGKRRKRDVQEFESLLMHHVLRLHNELKLNTYAHGGYEHFRIADPKPRDIHKALVRDRLLHHALYRKLYPFFDRTFTADSYSCRERKGTHAAMERFREFAAKVSKNRTRTCYVLKCDIRKFFASVDHAILKDILGSHIPDTGTRWLLGVVIDSFSSGTSGKGLPLGNLTSQLLVNIYMNEFDQFVKHKLKAKYYVRYADDFVIFSHSRESLQSLVMHISGFLRKRLKLELHPNKVYIRTIASGVDFLGWVHFPDHRVLRTTSKRRMLRRAEGGTDKHSVQSYLGMLGHGNAHKLRRRVRACVVEDGVV